VYEEWACNHTDATGAGAGPEVGVGAEAVEKSAGERGGLSIGSVEVWKFARKKIERTKKKVARQKNQTSEDQRMRRKLKHNSESSPLKNIVVWINNLTFTSSLSLSVPLPEF